MRLVEFFEGLDPCRCVTIIGCGGKTSLLWRLAAAWGKGQARRSVLVTTTTRILVPPAASALYDRFAADGSLPPPVPGVTLALALDEAGKGRSLPARALAEAAPTYERVLVEGDGSRGLPLKGWADWEPVVPAGTTVTVGVLPLWTLGLPVSAALVHRLPLFCALTGAREGQPLEVSHLARLVSGPQGLFAKARGKKVLFFNQTEDDESFRRAESLAALLPAGVGLSAILAGSVHRDECRPLSAAG